MNAPRTPTDLDHDNTQDAPPDRAQQSVDTTRKTPEAAHRSDPSDPAAPEPKLPHEHDQSVGMTDGQRDATVEQAYRDVQRGIQDTDRGPPSEKAYQKQK